MSFYKMVDDRVELALRLEALIENNAEVTARALAALFAPLADFLPAEAWYEGELLRQRLLVRLVANLRRTMVDAAEVHCAECRTLEVLRARRDEKLAALYDELVEIRRQARAFYGGRAATIIGLRGRTHRRPWLLARQARQAVDCLAAPVDDGRADSELDAARRGSWLETLAPLQAVIEPAIEAVIRGKTATICTLKAKQEAMRDFDFRFGCAGRYAKSAYDLAGLHGLAAIVPPRVARKDRRKSASRPSRSSEEIASLQRERLLDLTNVVDFGRWVKERLLRLRAGSRRRRA